MLSEESNKMSKQTRLQDSAYNKYLQIKEQGGPTSLSQAWIYGVLKKKYDK